MLIYFRVLFNDLHTNHGYISTLFDKNGSSVGSCHVERVSSP